MNDGFDFPLFYRYRQFTYSYHHLIVEVERRRKVAEDQEALRVKLMETLESDYQGKPSRNERKTSGLTDGHLDEVHERQKWVADHGHYLPQDLCAFIFVSERT